MMSLRIISRFWRGAVAVAGVVLAVTACQDQNETQGLLEPDAFASSELTVALVASDVAATAGDRLSLGVELDPPAGVRVGALQGYIHFNPTALEYVGQVPNNETMVVINDREAHQGTLRFLSVDPAGLDEIAATLGFDVLQPGFEVTFQAETAVSLNDQELEVRFDKELRQVGLASAAAARQLTDDELVSLFPTRSGDAPQSQRAPGDADFYGDVDNSGLNPSAPAGTVDGNDVLPAARLAVGILDCIVGTGGGIDCVAANVRPVGPPVGVESTGGEFNRIVDGNDVLAIAREAVGTLQDVVGDAIPKFNPTQPNSDIAVAWCASQGKTCSATGPDTVFTGTFTLTNDRIWNLERAIRVGDDGAQQNVDGARAFGNPEAGTLNVEAGTRIEAASGTSILITRAGQIFAEGTPSQPIHFTCDAASPAPQCWAGLAITGNATINEDDGTATNDAPDLTGIGRGTTGGTGVNQRLFEGVGTAGGQGVYIGGNDDTDNSGTLRYVVISYGGQALTTDNELNNLTMGTIGSGTTIEYVQTHAGLDDGFEWFGGTGSYKFFYATANTDDQVDYSFGFDGDLQYVLIQTLGQSDKGFEVDNTETGSTLNTTPRTEASLWNVTVVGGTAPGSPADKLANYRRGAGSNLNNMLLVEGSTVFDVDDVASCQLLGGQLQFNEFVVLGNSGTVATSGQSKGTDCSTLGTPMVDYLTEQTTAGVDGLIRGEVRAYAGELVAPFDPLLPDYRPLGSGVSAAFSPATPPAGFDQTATFLGAVRPAGLGGQLPWYAGWTIGWQNSTTR